MHAEEPYSGSDLGEGDAYNEEDDHVPVVPKLTDKASFREQSAAFHKVLAESSKYRHGDKSPIPSPRYAKPGALKGISSRPVSNLDQPANPISPRAKPTPKPRHLERARFGDSGEADSPQNAKQNNLNAMSSPAPTQNQAFPNPHPHKERDRLAPLKTNMDTSSKRTHDRSVSLPPVADMGAGKNKDYNLSKSWGYQGERALSPNPLGTNSRAAAPKSPLTARGSNKISLNDTSVLSSPRGHVK